MSAPDDSTLKDPASAKKTMFAPHGILRTAGRHLEAQAAMAAPRMSRRKG